jgi:hypothetical protein
MRGSRTEGGRLQVSTSASPGASAVPDGSWRGKGRLVHAQTLSGSHSWMSHCDASTDWHRSQACMCPGAVRDRSPATRGGGPCMSRTPGGRNVSPPSDTGRRRGRDFRMDPRAQNGDPFRRPASRTTSTASTWATAGAPRLGDTPAARATLRIVVALLPRAANWCSAALRIRGRMVRSAGPCPRTSMRQAPSLLRSVGSGRVSQPTTARA